MQEEKHGNEKSVSIFLSAQIHGKFYAVYVLKSIFLNAQSDLNNQ